MKAQLLPLDAATYARHPLHSDERAWPETNCYVDLWIELLHSFGLDPVACLAFTLPMDFEGDQWTFFKQPLSDLYTLYGIDVQELTIWRPVVDHVAEQVALGRSVLVEVDPYFLPDTAGVSYKIDHTKTTIAVQSIDTEARTLGYFHNASYYALSGDDFDGLFRLGVYKAPEDVLAPYTEIVKFAQVKHKTPADLLATVRHLITFHLQRRPRANPVTRYRTRFPHDLDWLRIEGLSTFHHYAFATLRQCGACAELASSFIRWLEEHGEKGLTAAATHFETIANTAKTLQFKVARSVATQKPFDSAPLFDNMETAWDAAMTLLVSRYGA